MRLVKLTLISILFVWVTFLTTAAYSQNQCDKRASIIEMLSSRYSENTQAIGVTNKGGLIEVLTNKDGGTWTIIVTTPHGISCLVAAGEGWRQIPKEESKANET
ncbi:MAG: hypothetical protein V7776_04920 [Halopseudomonas aestusnigri]